MLKKVILASLIAFVMAFGAVVPAFAAVDRITAVVNDSIITSNDLEKRLKQVNTQINNNPNMNAEQKVQARAEVRNQILSDMIRESLVNQEITRNGIYVAEQEVDEALNNIKTSNNFNDQQLRDALAMQGFNYADYREELRRQILSNKLMNRKVRSKVVVTNEEISRYYEENKDAYQANQQYKVWNVYVQWNPNGSDREKQAANQVITGIYKSLQGGADFTQVVGAAGKTYGGGQLGTFRLTEVAPEFRDVISRLTPQTYSEIMYGNGAAQIFYVESVIKGSDLTMEDVKPEIQEILYNQKLEKKFEEWIEDLYKQSHIEVFDPQTGQLQPMVR